jgi:tetratricopeptide (TPR) repeat protein
MNPPRRIFLSAVVGEFPAEVECLHAALTELDCQVIDLASCPTYWRTVDKRARDLIASCDLVIHIAGSRCGRIPDAATVPSGKPRLSIAQMEHGIATELQSNLHVFLSADDAPEPEGLKPESDELRQLQQSHRESLSAAGNARALPADASEWTAILGSLLAARPSITRTPVIQSAKSAAKAAAPKPETVGGMPLAAVAVIVIGLIIVGLGALKIVAGKSGKPAEQTVAALDLNIVRRVLQGYTASFRDWQRDCLDVPNLYLDHWVRSTLPTSLQMPPADVTRALEQALSRDWESQLTMEDRIAAQVAARRYQAAIDLGLVHEKTLTADGLETAAIAAFAKYDESQLNSHLDRAVKFYRAAIERTSPEAPPIDLGRRHTALGRVLNFQGLSHEALPSLKLGVGKLEPLADSNPEEFGMALVLHALSDHEGSLEKSEQSVQRAVTLLEQKASKKPAYYRARAVLAALQLVSQGAGALAKAASGEVLMRNNVKDTEQTFGVDHPLTHTHLLNLARHLGKASRQVEAVTEQQAIGDKVMNSFLQSRVLEAEGYYQKLIRHFETGYGAEHPNVAATSMRYGIVLQNLERHAEAEPLFRRALQISERHFGAKHPQTTRFRMHLAYGLQSAGKSDEAERHFTQVTQEMENFGSWPAEEQREAALMMAESLSKKKKHDKALSYYEKALNLYPDHAVIERGNIMILMMNTYFTAGELGKARLTAEQALPLVLLNPEHIQNPERAILPMMNVIGVWKLRLRQQMPEIKTLFQGMFSKARVDPDLFEKLWKQVSETK